MRGLATYSTQATSGFYHSKICSSVQLAACWCMDEMSYSKATPTGAPDVLRHSGWLGVPHHLQVLPDLVPNLCRVQHSSVKPVL